MQKIEIFSLLAYEYVFTLYNNSISIMIRAEKIHNGEWTSSFPRKKNHAQLNHAKYCWRFVSFECFKAFIEKSLKSPSRLPSLSTVYWSAVRDFNDFQCNWLQSGLSFVRVCRVCIHFMNSIFDYVVNIQLFMSQLQNVSLLLFMHAIKYFFFLLSNFLIIYAQLNNFDICGVRVHEKKNRKHNKNVLSLNRKLS